MFDLMDFLIIMVVNVLISAYVCYHVVKLVQSRREADLNILAEQVERLQKQRAQEVSLSAKQEKKQKRAELVGDLSNVMMSGQPITKETLGALFAKHKDVLEEFAQGL